MKGNKTEMILLVGACEHIYSWIQLSPKEKGKMNIISNFQYQEN